MTIFKSEISSPSFPIRLTTPACAFIEAFLAPVVKAVSGQPTSMILTLALPLTAIGTQLLFDSIDDSMTIFKSEDSCPRPPNSLVIPARAFTDTFFAFQL